MLAAQLVTTQIVAFHFQRVYPWGLLANVPVLILSGWLTVATLFTTVVGLLWAPAGMWLGGTVWLGLHALLAVVSFFADLPYSAIPFSRKDVPLLIGVLIGAVALTHTKRVGEVVRGLLRDRPGRVAVAAGCATCVLVWFWAWRPPGLLEVTFLDVGQGEAALIRLPDARALLIDGGHATPTFDYGERVVTPFLLSRRVRRLDWMVMTHPDSDHARGLPSVLRRLSVGHVYGLPSVPLDLNADRNVRTAALARDVPMEYGAGAVLCDDVLDGRPLRIEVIYPRTRDDVELVDEYANNDSLVLLVTYGSVRMLFAGDIERDVEALLIERHTNGELDLRADVLKVPHHGSDSSSSPEFIEAVAPTAAIISVGERNRYGHPAAEVMQRYIERGIRLYRTDGTRCWVRAVRR